MSANLPLPPSINNAFVQFMRGGRAVRVKSKAYAIWQADAVRRLKDNCRPLEADRYAITIAVGINYQSDIDNRVKPILDALVAAKMIRDDRWIDRITVRRDQSIHGCRVEWNDAADLTVVTS